MAVKPILNIIGADPLAGAEIIKEAHNENYELLNDFIEEVQSEKAATDAGLQDQINNHLESATAHTASSIVNDSLVSGIKVSDALNTNSQNLTTHISNTSAHPSSSITDDSNVGGAKVKDSLNIIDSRMDAHVAGTAEKHGSDDILNESSVVGTNVSGALNTVQQQVNALVVSGTTNTTIGVYSLTAGGSVNAYTGTFAGATLFGGLKISATFNTVNTGASTFNFNSTGVKAIKVILATGSKSDLKGGELYGKVLLEYDGTDFIVVEKNFLNGGTVSTPTTVNQAITSLPTSVIKGRADWKVEGNTLQQVITNGDFAGGTTGWTPSGSTHSVTNKIMSNVGNGTGAFPNERMGNTKTFKTGNKEFYKLRVRVTNSVCSKIEILLYQGTIALATITNPIQNQWYDIYGIVTGTLASETPYIPIIAYQYYSDAATANGKVMEIDGNIGVFLIPLTGTPYENYTADQMNALVTMYFEGLKGVENPRVKSVGKNLFDGQLELGGLDGSTGANLALTDRIRSKNFNRIKPNTAHKISSPTGLNAGDLRICYYDKNRKFITSVVSTDILNSDAAYYKFALAGITSVTKQFMLNEGATALPFENYSETETYLPVTLNRLPNLVVDSVDDKGVFVKRVQEYTLQSADITSLVTTGVNNDYAVISKKSDMALFGDSVSTVANAQKILIPNFIAGIYTDTTANVGTVFNSTNIGLVIAKGTYANLAAAQAALAGTKILYQLATPITTQLPISNIIAEPSGTLYVDNIFSDVDFYGTNITVTGRTFNSIEKVIKIDKATGAETDITSTCTLTTAKDGFTSTALVEGDLVWFALESTGTMIPSLTYSYPMDIKAAVEGNTKAIQQIDNTIEETVLPRLNEVSSILQNAQSTSTTLSELEQVKSVSDSYSSPAELVEGGASLNQAVVNGDFTNGTTGWTGSGATLSTSNKVLSIVGNGVASSGTAYNPTITNAYSGQKIFFKARVRVTNANCTSLSLRVGGSTGGTDVAQTITSPVQNQWYDLYALNTFNSSDTGTIRVDLRHDYADAATANGKVMEVDGNTGVFAIPITGTPYENYTADQMNAMIGKYFEGLQGAKDVVVGSRGRNLFDLRKVPSARFTATETVINTGLSVVSNSSGANQAVELTFKLKPSTQYTINTNIQTIGGAPLLSVLNFDTGAVLVNRSTSGQSAFTTPSNGKIKILLYSTYNTTAVGNIQYTNLSLNEGSTALPYTPYEGSQVTISATRHKLPNLVEDTMEFKDGKFRFVKRTAEYTLQAGDISSLVTSSANYDRVTITRTNLAGIYIQEGGITQSKIIIPNFKPYPLSSLVDDAQYVNTYYDTFAISNTTIGLIVPKGQYANLAAAQTALAGTKIVYQLATPIVIEEKDFAANGILVNGALSSNADFTEYFVDSYDIFAPTTVTYPNNLSKAMYLLKESVESLNNRIDTLGTGAWIAPTLVNSFVNFGGTDEIVGYYKDELGDVHLKGKIKTGASGASPFTLPVGYRPLLTKTFVINSNNAFGTVTIASTGVVTVTGNSTFYSLDGITFKAGV